jgi:phospholipase C
VKRLSIIILSMALTGCAQSLPQAFNLTPSRTGSASHPATLRRPTSSQIAHVVIIIQENRTPDNLFNGLPGADTVQSGKNSKGQRVQLQPELLTAPYDITHRHSAFQVEYANGQLDGFNLVQSRCKKPSQCPPRGTRPYAYVPQYEVQPYFDLAEQYAFADSMFQTNEGPSFPAHQYFLSGTSTTAPNSGLRASENPASPTKGATGGCDSPAGSLVLLIDKHGYENQMAYPCFDRPALSDLLDAQSLTWHYYQEYPGAGLWNGPDAILHVRQSPEYYTDVITPPRQILTDIGNGYLANVTWVTPTVQASDHAGHTDGSGPSWVASVVNAIGNSQFWNSTAIFVTWDDWGGWYDHVKPAQYNSYELSFRVPLIVISPYAKSHYVSHQRHEFGSILKFVEENFGLGSLNTTDKRSDDLLDCFNFSKGAQRFVRIRAPLNAAYFLRQPNSGASPDDDY